MDITSIIVAVLIFNGVIIFHEFGHYIAARKCKVGVTNFSIGFGPKLISFKKNGTRFSIKALPFGGSCEMLDEHGKEARSESKDKSYQDAKLWERALIVAAGPGFNIILAFIISICLTAASGVDKAIVSSVINDSPAAVAGLKAGDEIISFNGNGIANAREYSSDISLLGVPDEIKITYKRNGEKNTISFSSIEDKVYRMGIQHDMDSNVVLAAPKGYAAEAAGLKEGDKITSIDGKELSSSYTISNYLSDNILSEDEILITYIRDGKTYETTLIPTETVEMLTGFNLSRDYEKVSGFEIIDRAFGEISYYAGIVPKSFMAIFSGSIDAKTSIAGPVGTVEAIAGSFDGATKDGVLVSVITAANLVLLLSALIGFTNLLPVPPLDGCQLLIFAIEAVRRKPASEKLIIAINSIGFILIMALLMYATVMDIIRML